MGGQRVPLCPHLQGGATWAEGGMSRQRAQGLPRLYGGEFWTGWGLARKQAPLVWGEQGARGRKAEAEARAPEVRMQVLL